MSLPENRCVDLVVVGGGPAGMAAAVAAYEKGIKSILIIERDDALGGILRQCIHNGFGLHRFGEELTGPEYAYRYEKTVAEYAIPYMTGAMVIDITSDKLVTVMSSEHGIFTISAKAVILAMGCRERPKGALNISGSRPAGIYTAGTAQKFVNMKGLMPGREVVILGSGDIGLIMARRMTLEGAHVNAVCELMPYSGGLARNIEQCLNDFDIPLLLSHTVVDIHGRDRLTAVTIAEVDGSRRPISGTERTIPCDTLLLSCGLIPENELTKASGIQLDTVTGGAVVDGNRECEIEGIFACGNVLHVHDLVDYVSEESVIAGEAAARYIKGERNHTADISIKADGRIRYTVPQKITNTEKTKIYFRVSNVFKNVKLVVKDGDRVLLERKKQKVAPGEMETVILTEEMLAPCDKNTTLSFMLSEVEK